MPRHRIEHEPRHRAPRVDRRVQFSAASSRSPSHAKPPTRSGHAKPSTGPSHAKPSTEPGQLGKAFEAIGTGASERLSAAGTRIRREQREMLSGAVRGLMVSPWFAAGAGFVIAAGAFMYAPHASVNILTAPGRTSCSVQGCTVPQQAPVITGTEGTLITPSPSPSTSAHTPRHAAHDESDGAPAFTYTIEQHGSGMFQMTFTVTSDRAIAAWQLAFEIPGASDLSVTGATWRESGSDGGTASGPAAGSTPSAGPSSFGGGGGGQSYSVSFVVDGKGPLSSAPEHCTFNNNPCQFSQQH